MSTCTDLVSNCCMKRAYWTLPSSSRGTRSRKASNCSFVSSRLKRLSMAARNSSWLIVSVPRRSIFLQWHEMVTGHHDRRSWQYVFIDFNTYCLSQKCSTVNWQGHLTWTLQAGPGSLAGTCWPSGPRPHWSLTRPRGCLDGCWTYTPKQNHRYKLNSKHYLSLKIPKSTRTM